MPACGEAYKHLIRSSTGKAPEAPCEGLFGAELYCNAPDYSDWYAGTSSLRTKVQTKVRDLNTRAAAAGRQDVADAVLVYVHPAEAMFASVVTPEDLGIEFPGSTDIVHGIQKMIAAQEYYACALEQIDLAYARIGQAAPGTPGAIKPSSRPGSMQDWVGLARKGVVLASVIGSLYVVGRYVLPHVIRREAT
jgi:hypothetical protein